MNRETFIADASVRILASSYANSTALPHAKESVNAAIELWDELVSRNIVSSIDEKKHRSENSCDK
ncbi:hypothetical protein VU08_02805 [Desulfobulbus sp. F5]|nr:hypothetical protein [Desulfobulbus sp. F5]